MAQIPPPLQPILGSDVLSLTEVDLGKLLGQEETQFLEYKSEVGDSLSDRLEFATDVAALANGGGGLLIVGIDEDGDGRAGAIDGVAVTSVDLSLQLEQVIASRVQPALPVTLGRVVLGNGNQVILVAIEGGPLRPHAVLDGTKRMSYAIRRGRHKGYLTEPEVAESYSRRFTSASRRAQDLSDLHVELVATLPLESQGWTVMSLLPSTPGSNLSLSMNLAHETARWMSSVDDVTDLGRHWNTRVGYRAVAAADEFDQPRRRALLRLDGSGSAAYGALGYWLDKSGAETRMPPPGAPLRMRRPVQYFLGVFLTEVMLLASHAARAGATGIADVAVQFVVDQHCHTEIAPPDRSARGAFVDDHDTFVVGPSRISRRTVDLSELNSNLWAVVEVASALALDIGSEYGCSYLGVFDDAGRIDIRLAQAYAKNFLGWAQAHGLTS